MTRLRSILTTLVLLLVVFALIPQIPAADNPNAPQQGNPTVFPTNTAEGAVVPSPTITWRGPVVGGGYTPPPTWTPQAPAPTGSALPNVITPGAVVPDGAAATAAPAVSPSFTPMPNLDASRMGIQVDANLSDADWAEAMRRVTENLSVGWVKVQVPWRDMQPVPGEFDAAFLLRLEQHIEDANRRGLRVLVSVVKAPTWARSNQNEDGPPDNPQHLADFLTLLLNQINPGLQRPVVGEYIDAVEIWNEPNLIREWRGSIPFNGAGYMQLFEPAYRAIRAYSPSIPIITAGLAPTGTNSGVSIDDTEYLRQMYAAGLGGYSDVFIGIHPYGWANSPDALCCGTRGWDDNPHFFFMETVRAYRDIMVANGHSNNRLWVTEFGWATWDGFPNEPPTGSEWMRFNDRWAQANYTIRAFEIGQTIGYIEGMILWNLNFAMLEGLIPNRDERIGYSLVIPVDMAAALNGEFDNGTERPLYWMIYDAVRHDVQLDRYD